ncbi:MAG: hypothetical protein ACOCW8_00315 [bacterium]
MKKVIIITSLILFPFMVIMAAQKVTGAFGFKFGETFNINDATRTSETKNGLPLYGVTPEKPVKYFKNYFLKITPKSKKIYSIWGIGHYNSNQRCVTDLEVVKALMEKKYGEFNKPDFSFHEIYSFYGDSKIISIKCQNNFSDADLYAIYTDTRLEEVAEKERVEIEAENTDTSGL